MSRASLESLQRSIDSLDASVDERNARDARLRGACESLLFDLESHYDGCPDSITLWMGKHIRDLKACGITAATTTRRSPAQSGKR